ncbi:MAG: Mur ligase family protein, partial [Planctomycetota bacterium]|nr:Mur ligase family protein [Planctomycetota bacterium]
GRASPCWAGERKNIVGPLSIIKYAEAVGLLMRRKIGIAISGTHGKTSTSSLIAYLLTKAGLHPSFIVGGVLQDFQTGSVFGEGNYFIAEACEYDRSFHHLPARIKIITNIEPDHMDYYKTFNNLVNSFRQFIQPLFNPVIARKGWAGQKGAGFIATTPQDGFVIANIEDPGVQKCLKEPNNILPFPRPAGRGSPPKGVASRISGKKRHNARVITFGSKHTRDSQWYPRNIRINNNRWHFETWRSNKKYGDFILGIPGEHNVLNALVAIIVAEILGIDKNITRKALAEFKGVHRRFEVIARIRERVVIDDYGHHPTELQTVISTARTLFPNRRLWIIFQPHLYSRTKLFLKEFVRVLCKTDIALIPPIYSARDIKPSQQVISSEEVVSEINKSGGSARYFPDFASIVKYLTENTIPYDIIITVGAGDVWKVGWEFVRKMR